AAPPIAPAAPPPRLFPAFLYLFQPARRGRRGPGAAVPDVAGGRGAADEPQGEGGLPGPEEGLPARHLHAPVLGGARPVPADAPERAEGSLGAADRHRPRALRRR